MTEKMLAKDQDKFVLRLPPGMRDQIAREADANGRSMNAEIVARLTEFGELQQRYQPVVRQIEEAQEELFQERQVLRHADKDKAALLDLLAMKEKEAATWRELSLGTRKLLDSVETTLAAFSKIMSAASRGEDGALKAVIEMWKAGPDALDPLIHKLSEMKSDETAVENETARR